MFTVYQGNRLETLAERLVDVLARPLSDPMLREVIVTQHQGMARWIAQRFAQAHGVAANIDFPFPSAFIWRLFHSQLPDVPERSGFDRDTLVWRVYALLDHYLARPGFEPLVHYLSSDGAGLKRYQLARQIADVFDQYLIYRPDWVLAWERGAEQHWQAQLWRALAGDAGQACHRARLYKLFIDRARSGALAMERLPERVVVFGIHSMPPAYLDVLAALGQVVDVHLFVVNPSVAFWEDIVDDKALARLRARWRKLGLADASDYYPQGNGVLASMGRQGRDFFALLQAYAYQEQDCFELPEGNQLLAMLQLDMLELVERGGDATGVVTIADADESVQVHAVHSPMREVQVLHDQLLALFERHADLRPQDVVVMTPAIDRYAPYIEAVFGSVPAARYIPWTVVDRSAQAEHPILSSFMQLLGLTQSRFGASEVMALLEVPALARTLGLEESALERLRQWIVESGIRWGLDGADRSGLGLPTTGEHSWEFGFNRLLLGYAMPSDTVLYRGISPYPAIEGGETAWLGVLMALLRRLRGLRQRLAGQYPIAEWQILINELLTLFTAQQEDEQDALQLIRNALQGMVENAALAGYAGPLPLVVVQDYLKGHLTDAGTGQRFLTGQVNFCAMMPMRSIPFRVVCMLGMNDSDYPRSRHSIGFDLMAGSHQAGDRSRRDEDRYLFLEAVLSAREYLYISYVGRCIRDNSALLPSVLVTELLDYIEQGYRLADGDLRRRLVREHPLQPFGRQYFDGSGPLFSYAAEWLAGSQALHQPRTQRSAFVEQPMALSDAAERVVTLDELIYFFRKPARAFLRNRLGLALDQQAAAIEDSEPFDIDALASTRLKARLLALCLQGGDIRQQLATLTAEGGLPYGGFGAAAYDKIEAEVEKLAAQVLPLMDQPQPPLAVDMMCGDTHLTGTLSHLVELGRVAARCAKLTGNDVVDLWINHLVLNSQRSAHVGRQSWFVAQDKRLDLLPQADAAEWLQQLLAIYWRGQTTPLPFYPKSSFAFARKWLQSGDADAARQAALKCWEDSYSPNGWLPGEHDDAYYQLALRGRDPLDSEFAQLAIAVFKPILDSGVKL